MPFIRRAGSIPAPGILYIMSINITFKATKQKRPIFNKPLKQIIKKSLQSNKIQERFSIKVNDFSQELTIELSECYVTPIFIRFAEDKDTEILKGEIQTNITGPGFHKNCINFLDELKESSKIDLKIWDEADYFPNKDFNKLRNEHFYPWLSTLTSLEPQELNSKEPIYITWPIGPGSWKPAERSGIITPTGNYKPQEFINKTKNIETWAKEFFIWNNENPDAYFYRNLAIHHLWNDFCFVKPRTSKELNILNIIHSNLLKSAELSSKIKLPLKAWESVIELGQINYQINKLPNPEQYPEKNIGYRKEDIILNYPANWKVRIPGNFILSDLGRIKKDGQPETVVWDLDRNFRMSVWNTVKEKPQEIIKNMTPKNSKENGIKSFAKDGFKFGGKYQKTVEEEIDIFILSGYAYKKPHLALVTITYQDSKYKDWALETFKSIQPPKHIQKTT